MSLSTDIQNLNLDVNNIGAWPVWARSLAIVLVCVAVLVAGFVVVSQPQLDALAQAEKKEITLRSQFESKQSKAAKLALYKEQMKEMERSFGTLLRQLPSKTEVAELLSEVSSAGSSNGLKFNFFQPEDEVPQDFYVELPIRMDVFGSYHQFGQFVSDIARLPRIVTLHDFLIKSSSDGGFTMSAQAKTYRYLDEDELASMAKKKRKAGKR